MGSLLELEKRKNPILELQIYLRDLSNKYNEIPKIIPTGSYDPKTIEAVSTFQRIFNLPVTGTVDYNTWKKIVEEAEKYKETTRTPEKLACFPSNINELKPDDEGDIIYILQIILKNFNKKYKNYPSVNITGKYDRETQEAVKEFQHSAGLPVTGIVNRETWNTMVAIYNTCKLHE